MRTFMSAVVLAAVMVVGSGAALAGKGERHPSLLRGAGKTAAEEGAFEHREPLEAGKLPSREGTVSPGNGIPGGEQFQAVEVGGRAYRIGIDTH